VVVMVPCAFGVGEGPLASTKYVPENKWAWDFLYAVFCDVRLFVSKRMLLWKPLNPSYTAVVQQTSKLGG